MLELFRICYGRITGFWLCHIVLAVIVFLCWLLVIWDLGDYRSGYCILGLSLLCRVFPPFISVFSLDIQTVCWLNVDCFIGLFDWCAHGKILANTGSWGKGSQWEML